MPCRQSQKHQALVITHELAKPECYDTYLADVFKPAVPLLSMGRSYKASPQCKPMHTVYHWWKDRRALRQPQSDPPHGGTYAGLPSSLA